MKRKKSQSQEGIICLVIIIAAVLMIGAFGTIDRIAANADDLAETEVIPLFTSEDTALVAKAVIIERAEEELEDKPATAPMPEPTAEPDPAELEMLACVIYVEAGGDACSDLARQYVGDVVLNRVADPRFPDTLEGVLLQKGQYGRFHWTGIVWPERAKNETETAAVERAYETARHLLSGEHSELYGAGYIWQAEFTQGTDVIYLDGLYFGR